MTRLNAERARKKCTTTTKWKMFGNSFVIRINEMCTIIFYLFLNILTRSHTEYREWCGPNRAQVNSAIIICGKAIVDVHSHKSVHTNTQIHLTSIQ